MSKSNKEQRRVQFRPAPEIVSMAVSAVGRLQKLLGICETRVNVLEDKAAMPDELSNRDILSLGRMIVTLQKELDKYAAIVHPATEMVYPATTTVETHKKGIVSDVMDAEDLNDTATLLRESMSALVQDLEAIQGGELPSSLTKPYRKKQAKAQKFSHAFFQKRPQTATL